MREAARTVLCGACDETPVPTATKPRAHHAVRRRGGRLAACSKGTAACAAGEKPALASVGHQFYSTGVLSSGSMPMGRAIVSVGGGGEQR